jgi:hypothetical protein
LLPWNKLMPMSWLLRLKVPRLLLRKNLHRLLRINKKPTKKKWLLKLLRELELRN